MTKEKQAELCQRGDFMYWDMLGSLTGFENNVERGLRWLSGKLFWSYYTESSDVEDVIIRITNKEVPERIFFGVCDINSTRIRPFTKTGLFRLETGFSMFHDLNDVKEVEPCERVEIVRVTDPAQLKMTSMMPLGQCTDIFTYKNYVEMQETPGTVFYLAECDGVPVGTLMAQYGDDFVQISWVFTKDGYRKRGISGYMIQVAEREAVEQGKKYGVLSAGIEGKGSYSRVGYEIISPNVALFLNGM